MKYTCDCINSLFFDFNCVQCGCSNSGGIKYLVPFDGTDFDLDKINQKRFEIYQGFADGIVSPICEKCYMLKEVDGDIPPFEKTLDRIYISHWYHCNCGCIYCTNQPVSRLKITPKPKRSDYYDILPIVKELTQTGYIREDTEIYSIGGEPTILKEYDEVINELTKYSKNYIYFLSNGIEFSETIYKFLERGHANLIISLDCGTPKMYKKIKRVDGFNKVIKNAAKYSSAVHQISSSVVLKYIIINGLNDNLAEIRSFIEVAEKAGVKSLYLDIDHNIKHKLKTIPAHWPDLFEYFLSAKNVNAKIHDYCQQILDKKVIF